MCGGVGSRLKPLTENTPKPLIKMLNKPVLESIIERVIESGITDIYLSLGYMAGDIQAHCEKIDFSADLTYCIENKPLGTAGGVKNCIGETDDDILVLSGDNIFDFDLKKLYDYHYRIDSDFTVCAVDVDDPREYGVISCDDDNSIKGFIEKPTWEQAVANLVNTGIYVFKGNVLSMIPDNEKFDFSDDLFPKIFKSNMRFMCYKSDGYWGDMGEICALKRITKDILTANCRNFRFNGGYFGKDTVLENGAYIKAPCIIGKNTEIHKGASIGPNCVIGNDSIISENCTVADSIVGDSCNVGSNCDLNGCVIDDCVRIKDNCSIETDCVIGFSSTVGRFARILPGNKVWPGRRIASETVVAKDMLFENPDRIEFDIFGLSGKANSQISLSDVTVLGQAIASVSGINRVGIGSDISYSSENFRSAVICGLRACGATCYDYGEMFRSQAYFYSAYCNLDFFIFISSSGDIVSVSFFGKNGMPVASKTARMINNNYKFSAFNFCEPSQYKEIFNMKLFPVVYKSFFKKICPLPLKNISVNFESENSIIKNLFDELFSYQSASAQADANKLQILVNNSASEIFVVENGKVFSGERILALLCELEAADGKEILIPEESPSIIEDNAEKYQAKVTRVYENNVNQLNLSERFILNSIWTFDMFLMVARLIKVMSEADISLVSLFECHKNFALRKSILDITDDSLNIRKLIVDCGAKKQNDDIYYVFDGRMGKVRMRQMGNARKIRILAEADDMEAAKEISVSVIQKIKNSNIDKEL